MKTKIEKAAYGCQVYVALASSAVIIWSAAAYESGVMESKKFSAVFLLLMIINASIYAMARKDDRHVR